MSPAEILLAICMFLGAMLYASVGQGGASAYLALMAIFGISPDVMRPTALAMNILVAAFVTVRYFRAGLFRWRATWPFLIGAMPLAMLGGAIQLPVHFYRPLVGVILWVAAAPLLWLHEMKADHGANDPPISMAALIGAGIGLLSGLTGIGGGIVLSPVLLFARWSSTKMASGIAAFFILCNSIAGLVGNLASLHALPPMLPLYAGSALAGALVGTAVGIRFTAMWIQKALGLVLILVGFWLMVLP
jgi:uncharacterized membrane protein YfcA